MDVWLGVSQLPKMPERVIVEVREGMRENPEAKTTDWVKVWWGGEGGERGKKGKRGKEVFTHKFYFLVILGKKKGTISNFSSCSRSCLGGF